MQIHLSADSILPGFAVGWQAKLAYATLSVAELNFVNPVCLV
jgi:hypothetical protein